MKIPSTAWYLPLLWHLSNVTSWSLKHLKMVEENGWVQYDNSCGIFGGTLFTCWHSYKNLFGPNWSKTFTRKSKMYTETTYEIIHVIYAHQICTLYLQMHTYLFLCLLTILFSHPYDMHTQYRHIFFMVDGYSMLLSMLTLIYISFCLKVDEYCLHRAVLLGQRVFWQG